MSFDATGRLASVTAPNGETIAFTYDAGGRLVEQRLNSGQRTTQTWFEDGNLKQKQNLFNATTLSNHVYTLDNQGRRAGQTETIAGIAKTWSYAYDNLDRLTEANDGVAETYGYDIFGNRRSKTQAGVPSVCPRYVYDIRHADFSTRLTVR